MLMAASPHSSSPRPAASWAALLAVVSGVLVLCGWAWGIPTLKSLAPGWVSMKANTAAGFVLLGTAMGLVIRPPLRWNPIGTVRLARVLAALSGLAGLLTLGEYLFAWDLGIDQCLFSEPPGTPATSHPGRMAPETALCFTLLASAVGFNSVSEQHWWGSAAASCSLLVLIYTLTAMLAYLTPEFNIFGWFSHTLMAMHTAVLFTVLSAASMATSWRRHVLIWSLGKTAALAMVFSILTLVFIGLHTSRSQAWLKDTQQTIQSRQELMGAIDSILANAAEAQTYAISYLVTGDTQFLHSHLSAKANVANALETLAGIDRARQPFAQIEAPAKALLQWHQQAINAGRSGVSENQPQTLLERGADLLAELHQTAARLKAINQQAIKHLDQTSKNVSDQSYLAIFTGAFAGLALFLTTLLRLNFAENQRRQAERILRDSEARLKAIVDAIPVPLALNDGQGNITYLNQEFIRRIGYDANDIPTLEHWWPLAYPDPQYRKWVEKHWHDAMEKAKRSHEAFTPIELDVRCKDGQIRTCMVGAASLTENFAGTHLVILYDISERRRNEILLALQARRAEALLELPKAAETLDETMLIQHGLELVENLTESQVSFAHFINSDEETIELVAWSRRTLECYCNAAYDKHYPLSKAGIWADAVRRQQPMVYNHYAAYPEKRGLPEGHAPLQRLASIPVIEDGRVVMLLGVGNKDTDYTDLDVETLQLIANGLWHIVQRRRTEAKAARFSRVLEDSLNEIYLFESQTLCFVDVNLGARNNLGYSLEELQRMTPLDIKPDLDAESFEALLAPLRAGVEKRLQFEARHRRKDGSFYPVEVRTEMTGDDPPLFVQFIQDISERKQAEEDLRKLAQAVEQSPESIVITDVDARIEYANDAFLSITGYSREEVLGQNPRILNSGKTPPKTHAALWDALTQGKSWKGQFINKKKDGSEYVEFAIITPLYQADGRVSHYVAVKEDITEKKRLGEELDRHRHHLEELVAQRTSELMQAKLQAEAANQAKSAFLANVSHEIRTPMNAIIGLSHLCLESTVLPAKQHDQIGKIHRAATALLAIINDILDYSKIETGQLALRHTAFRLPELFEQIHAMIGFSAQEKGLELKFDLPANMPDSLLGDSLRLRQVLLNLAGNAVKFTRHGKIELACQIVEWRDKQVWLRFCVRDTGMGMTRDQIERIFDSFSQGDESTTRRHGGAGLGLAISKHLVELMGGAIEVESKPGKGSTFGFTLRFDVNDKQAGYAAAPLQPIIPVGKPAIVPVPAARPIRISQTLNAELDTLANLLRENNFKSGQHMAHILSLELPDELRSELDIIASLLQSFRFPQAAAALRQCRALWSFDG